MRRRSVDANHFLLAVALLVVAFVVFIRRPAGNARIMSISKITRGIGGLAVLAALLSGALMLFKVGGADIATRLGYTTFDVSLLLATVSSVVDLSLSLGRQNGLTRENE